MSLLKHLTPQPPTEKSDISKEALLQRYLYEKDRPLFRGGGGVITESLTEEKPKTWNPGVGQGGSVNLLESLVKAYPDADRDLLEHYAKVKEMNTFKRLFYPLGKELRDWTGYRSNTGFSWDDIGADIAGARYTPEEANRRGLFTHTEGDNWTGQGQGLFTEVLRKIMSKEYQTPNTTTPKNSGLAEYPHLQKYRN